MDEQQEAISQFCSITGAQTERARFFLESAKWDLSLAMASFYENGEQENDESEQIESDTLPTNPLGPQSSGQPQNSSGIGTLASMRAREESSGSEEEGQAFYAGNSRESGQQILGPGRPKRGGNHVAAGLFKAAKEPTTSNYKRVPHTSNEEDEDGDDDDNDAKLRAPITLKSVHSEQKRRQKEEAFSRFQQRAGAETVERSGRPGIHGGADHFSGTGYRLGESESEQSLQYATPTRPKPFHVVLKLYKTGFTVNDEELRLYEDPRSHPFLESVRRGQIPVELASRAHGGEVSVDMEDHRDEEHSPPKTPKHQAFVGQGQTLGGDHPGTSRAVMDIAPALVIANESEPTTNVQIRLADGSRLVVKLNHTHTIRDLRRHIAASRPQYAQVPFGLSTAFPSKPLLDDAITLKEADLLNAAIIQKL